MDGSPQKLDKLTIGLDNSMNKNSSAANNLNETCRLNENSFGPVSKQPSNNDGIQEFIEECNEELKSVDQVVKNKP